MSLAPTVFVLDGTRPRRATSGGCRTHSLLLSFHSPIKCSRGDGIDLNTLPFLHRAAKQPAHIPDTSDLHFASI